MLGKWNLAVAGVLIIIVGGLIAHFTQTSGGIKIQDIRFKGAKGNTMSALLYTPPNATREKPAPGILAVHGYINSRETQAGFAIEFARRGYVVLALDQTGHGYSDPPAFANGFGGPDALAYLRSLDFVDKANIGLEGHSMGGWTILAAATAMPNDYKSMVLEGSSTGRPFAAEGTTTWPRNVALVFAQYEEFPRLMWGVERAKDVVTSPKLLSFFGATGKAEPGKVYGDIAQGNARVLYAPAITHPAEHISHEAIGYSLDWFAKTLQGGTPLPASDQIWFRKELGTLIALVGFIVLLLGAFQGLLTLPMFAALAVASSTAKPPPRDRAWWTALLLTALVPALLYFPLLAFANNYIKPQPYLPQGITNQIAFWALTNAVLTLVLLYFAPKRAPRAGIVVSVDPDCGRNRRDRLSCADARRPRVQDRLPLLDRRLEADERQAGADVPDLPDPVRRLLRHCLRLDPPQPLSPGRARDRDVSELHGRARARLPPALPRAVRRAVDRRQADRPLSGDRSTRCRSTPSSPRSSCRCWRSSASSPRSRSAGPARRCPAR